jgi:endonuclease-3
MARTSEAKRHAAKVARILRQEYPNATCALDFRTPLELLVATILSAQCTDKRVNLVTKDLFQKYRSAADYARASPEVLERDIQSTGFFRNKAKSLIGCCTELVEMHGGEVPRDLETLVGLPGIGRKTANVVLGTAFKTATGVVVDTHVARVSRRLGLTKHKDPIKIEQDLMALIPQEAWIEFGHAMVLHGRRLCVARKPKCDDCPLSPFCPRIGVEKEPSR